MRGDVGSNVSALLRSAHYRDPLDLVHRLMLNKKWKERTVQVLPEYKDFIKSFHTDEKKQFVFEELPQNLDIHSYQRDFACEWYKRLARPLETLSRDQKYYCKGDRKNVGYDRRAMLAKT